jgi:hypothetical protein
MQKMDTISKINGKLHVLRKNKYCVLQSISYYELLVLLYQVNGNRMLTNKELDYNKAIIKERDGFSSNSEKWLDNYCYNIGISLNWIRRKLKKHKLSLSDKRFFVFIYASYYKTSLSKLIEQIWKSPTVQGIFIELMNKVYKRNFDKVVQEIKDEVAYRPAKVGYYEALDVFNRHFLLFAQQ